MGSAVIVEVDSIADCSRGLLKVFKAMSVDILLLQGPNDAFDHTVLLRTVRRNELLSQAVTSDQLSEWEAVKTRPLSDLNKKGLSPFPKGPLRAMRECLRAVPAAESFPERGSCQPNSSHV